MDIVGMVGGMMKSTRVMGWLAHLMVGTVLYGGAFVLILLVIDTESYVVVGLAPGAIGWSMVMLVMMPMADNGLFGLTTGIAMASFVTFTDASAALEAVSVNPSLVRAVRVLPVDDGHRLTR